MTTDRLSTMGQNARRRNALWPWLVMPLAVLALFLVLHDVRRSGGGDDQGISLGSGSP